MVARNAKSKCVPHVEFPQTQSISEHPQSRTHSLIRPLEYLLWCVFDLLSVIEALLLFLVLAMVCIHLIPLDLVIQQGL